MKSNPNIKPVTRRSHTTRRNRNYGHVVLPVLLALSIGFGLIALVSQEPVRAFLTLITGALPRISYDSEHGFSVSRLLRIAGVLEEFVTLSLLGMSVAVALKARQFSLGMDGQLFASALIASYFSVHLSGYPLSGIAVLVLAVCTGAAVAAFAGWLKIRFSCNEIVTTLMLNVLLIQCYRWIVSTHYHEDGIGFIATPKIPDVAFIAAFWPNTRVTWLIFLVPLLAWALRWFFVSTKAGYEIKMVGQSEYFGSQVGMPVKRVIFSSYLLGGAFSGLAGYYTSHAIAPRLPVDMNPGLGFEGLMVALLARLDPIRIPVAALLYCYLKVGALAMERTTDVPREMVIVIQAMIILFAVSDQLVPAIRGSLKHFYGASKYA